MSLLRQTILSVLTEKLTAEEIHDLVCAVEPDAHTKGEVIAELLKMTRQGLTIKDSKKNPANRHYINTYELAATDIDQITEESPMTQQAALPKAEFIEFFSLARVIMSKLDGINSLFINSDKITLLANGVAYDVSTPDDLSQLISAMETLTKFKQAQVDE